MTNGNSWFCAGLIRNQSCKYVYSRSGPPTREELNINKSCVLNTLCNKLLTLTHQGPRVDPHLLVLGLLWGVHCYCFRCQCALYFAWRFKKHIIRPNCTGLNPPLLMRHSRGLLLAWIIKVTIGQWLINIFWIRWPLICFKLSQYLLGVKSWALPENDILLLVVDYLAFP